MAFNKRTWKGRQGTGLNKFSIDGATPVTVINQPDSVTEQGDALSAGNLNDLEQRIYDAFDDIADGTQVVGKATSDASGNVIDQTYATKADLQDGTLVVKEAEIASKDEDGNNIKATYETKAEASDLKSALTAVDHRVENLEQAKGKYVVQNYKDGAITPSGKGNWAVVEGLRGVSRVKNQLVKNGNFANGATNWTAEFSSLSVSDGVATITKRLANPSYIRPSEHYDFITGHVYLGVAWLKGEYSLICIQNNVTYSAFALSRETPTDSEFSMCSFIYQFGVNDDPARSELAIRNGVNGSVGKTFYAKNIILTDLTVYFNTTDLSFLGATDSAKLATIQTNYPHLLTPSEYGTRIVDSSYSGVRAEGNLIDESSYGLISEISRYGLVADVDEGFFTLSGTAGQSYATGLYVNGNLTDIENVNGTFSRTFNVSEPCKLMIWINSSTNYLSNVMLNRGMVADPHCAYMPTQTLSLTFQGKSAGSVYDQLETNAEIVQEIDGEKVTIYKKRTTERIASVDLEQTDFTLYEGSDYWFFIGYVDNSKPAQSSASVVTQMTSRYRAVTTNAIGYADNTIALNSTTLRIRTDSKTNPPKGILNYALATESVTLSDPLIDNTLLTESGGRMSTVQTGTVVDGSFDMGFINL